MIGNALYGADLAAVYDLIYRDGLGKDYAAEADQLTALAHERCPQASSLLDVGCGTGLHLQHLRRHFSSVAGVELSEPMRGIAADRLGNVQVHQGDMRTLNLGRTFSVVTCLFAAIGYLAGIGELEQTMRRLAHHLDPGGVLIVEPWFTPEQWRLNSIHHTHVEAGNRTVTRVSHSTADGSTSTMVMHYLLADAETGISHWTETHTMSLFTTAQYDAAFANAGLVDLEWLDGWREGRARIIGSKP